MMLFFKSKKEKQLKRENDGYEFTAGKLLKGEPAINLHLLVECARHFNDLSHFEIGMSQALDDWKNKTGEKYDIL